MEGRERKTKFTELPSGEAVGARALQAWSSRRKTGMSGAGEDKHFIDIVGAIHGETEKAVRLYDGKVGRWIPRSLVEDHGDGTFTMPEWLAKDKGFI